MRDHTFPFREKSRTTDTMVWAQLDINRPHLVYIILGGFTSLFMLCSSIIKEKLYIGEATVATICGIIFGPHAANLIDPGTWGNVDQITLEFSRIVLVVQCFAVGVELPKAYMERHWKSVVMLLVPVMTFGWLITSLFVWGLIPGLNWLDSLCIAACVTATDPVLASSVVGKGKFAKRVPKHLRDLLSAESGCNDGMAFPFIYLSLYIIHYRYDANAVAFHWFCYTILYECIFGAFYGVCVGYIARRAIRAAHERDLIDRESFLVFYFVLALFCAGSGSMLGMDDLLIGFACGVGFSNDGWFTEKTEESHVSNVIDLLINLAFFVYFGTIIPWEQYNADLLGLTAWRLVVIGILVLLFRRIPAMMALKVLIPDVKTWREALFAGHFGPIGVGAIFVAILARAELETDTTTPLETLPGSEFVHYNIIQLIWPVTTFLVLCSIIVHGSSIAVFTLGKHINTLTLTMSYTQANEDQNNWMDRLPRIQSRSRSSMSLRRPDDTESASDEKFDVGAGPLPRNFLRRQKEEDTPASRSPSRRAANRRKQRESSLRPGGPVSQSAIAPVRTPADTSEAPPPPSRSDSETLAMRSEESRGNSQEKDEASPRSDSPGEKEGEVYEEGEQTVYEDEEGNVLEVEENEEKTDQGRQDHEATEARDLMDKKDVHHGVSRTEDDPNVDEPHEALEKLESAGSEIKEIAQHPRQWRKNLTRMGTFGRSKGDEQPQEKKPKAAPEQKHGPARAYQFGNTIIVEDEDGEVIKKYDIPGPSKKKKTGAEGGPPATSGTRGRMHRMASTLGVARAETGTTSGATNAAADGAGNEGKGKQSALSGDDDDRVRFTVSSGGRRMSKAEFIQQIQQLDPKMRARVVEASDVPDAVKEEAREDAREHVADQKKEAEDNKAGKQDKRGRVNLDPATLPDSETAATSDADADTTPHVRQVSSQDSAAQGPEGLTLIDSNNQDIPFHDVSGDIDRAHARSTSQHETPAQRRRREARARAQQQRAQEDSDDDGTPRVPPKQASPTLQRGRSEVKTKPAEDENGETAAERRRREGALGVSKEESDSEEEDAQRRTAPTAGGSSSNNRPGIRFADDPSPREHALRTQGSRARSFGRRPN